MNRGSIVVCLVFVFLAIPIVLAADGDPIRIISQSPSNGSYIDNSEVDIKFVFQFVGDIADCSLYGDWSGGWEIKHDPIKGVEPGSYTFSISTGVFECGGHNKWNVYCVEDNNSANYYWGDNRTFVYECPPPEEPPEIEGKSYSVFLSNPWEGEMYLGDRWLFEVGKDKFSLIVTNITADTATTMLTPTFENFTVGFLGYVDIDADGNKTKDLTVKMKRLFADYKVIFLIYEYGYEWPLENDTISNETINGTMQNTTANEITNNTLSQDTIIIVNQTAEKGTSLNASGDAKESGLLEDSQNSAKMTENDMTIEGLPLWIVLLIMLVIVIIVVYFAFRMLGPATV